MKKKIAGFSLALLAFSLTACAALDVEQGGINLISLDEEWGMRDDMLAQVQQQYTLLDDPQALAYLETIGNRLVARTKMADRPWTFGIVDDGTVNAFNLPGGLVFVNRGLIEQAETLDQFTAVLGHEIAHGVARHGTQLMTRAIGFQALSQILLGKDAGVFKQQIGGLVTAGVLSDYGRDAENEADRLGIRFSHAAGYDPKGAAAMFRTLLSLRQSRPNSLEQFFSSHPLTEERIQRAESLAAQLPDNGDLVHDSPSYQEFRRRAGQ